MALDALRISSNAVKSVEPLQHREKVGGGFLATVYDVLEELSKLPAEEAQVFVGSLVRWGVWCQRNVRLEARISR